MPHDEGTLSRQTSGWKEGASQAGMTGFGAFRNNTVAFMQAQDQRSQGMIPYQMGVNFLESQAGKTGFGQPRQVYTPFTDDTHEDLPADIARRPDVPFWTGQKEADHANQVKYYFLFMLQLILKTISDRYDCLRYSTWRPRRVCPSYVVITSSIQIHPKNHHLHPHAFYILFSLNYFFFEFLQFFWDCTIIKLWALPFIHVLL